MNKYTSTSTILLVGGIIACLGAIGVYGLFAYTVYWQGNVFMVEQERVARIHAGGEAQAALLSSYDSIMADHAALESYFIKEGEIVEFLELIEALGRSYGAEVATAQITIESGDEYTETLALSIKAIGSLPAVQHVLALLETLPYKSRVTNVTIVENDRGEGNVEWEGTFDVVVTKRTGS